MYKIEYLIVANSSIAMGDIYGWIHFPDNCVGILMD